MVADSPPERPVPAQRHARVSGAARCGVSPSALLVLLFGDLAEAVPLSVIAGLLFVIGAELIIDRLAVARLIERTSFESLDCRSPCT